MQHRKEVNLARWNREAYLIFGALLSWFVQMFALEYFLTPWFVASLLLNVILFSICAMEYLGRATTQAQQHREFHRIWGHK